MVEQTCAHVIVFRRMYMRLNLNFKSKFEAQQLIYVLLNIID